MSIRNSYVYFCVTLLIVSFGCRNKSEKPANAVAPVYTTVLENTTLLATAAEGDLPAVNPITSERHMGNSLVFSEMGRGVAYQVQKDDRFQVVHNGKPGKVYKTVEYLVLSKDGQRVVYNAEVNGKWLMVVDGNEGQLFDTVGVPRFSPDGRHILYDASIGSQWHLVVDGKVSEGHVGFYDKNFSSDSSKVFTIDNPPDENGPRKMVVRDLSLKKLSETDLFTSHTHYNKDKSRVAMVSLEKEMMRLVVFDYTNPKAIKYGPFYKDIGLEAFGPDEETVAYVAEKDGHAYVVMNDKEERLPPDAEIKQSPVIRPDKQEAGLILKNSGKAFFYQAFSRTQKKQKRYDEAANIVYSSDSQQYAYIAREGKRVFMVVNGFETPSFDMIVEPMFSPDGKMLVFRARKDGKRFVAAANSKGKLVQEYSKYDMVFRTVFTVDGKSVAYGVKDGNKLVWKVEKLYK